ncbi:NLI interacting factor [Macleaya cordata]|uniref:NLI interacting factor n=1 Tax=Macleaya cordata TaxID=56857 RepID=A0A200QSM1_MACCD|nr:NLI interacting factor [Macleaya cordata]
MVSKIIRKTPTKPTKDRRSRRRKKTPLKNITNASSIIIASINKSIFTCHRRLLKIFTKFTNIGTPNRRKQGFHILKKFPKDEEQVDNLVCRSLSFQPVLPPSLWPEKNTIFLDLDETLIHSRTDPPPEKFDFIVRPRIDGELMNFYVLKRPGVDEFLETISKNFEVIVFTAGLKEYASLVLDKLDSKGVISHRLYRDSCKEMDGRFVKDLSELGRDLKRVVLVDDNPNAYIFQPDNALPVRPFIDDLKDRELERVMKFFEVSDGFEDMRDAVKSYIWEGDQIPEMF